MFYIHMRINNGYTDGITSSSHTVPRAISSCTPQEQESRISIGPTMGASPSILSLTLSMDQFLERQVTFLLLSLPGDKCQ